MSLGAGRAGPAAEPTSPALGRAVVITCSTRAASGSTQTAPARSSSRHFRPGASPPSPLSSSRTDPGGEALRTAIASGAAVVVTTGGTGLSPTDATPEQTAPLLDRLVPGIAEAIRAAGARAGVPTAILSRGLAGLAGHTLVVNLPGSPGGVRDALAIPRRGGPARRRPGRRGDHRR